VFSGIFLTKFLGVIVLAFSESALFQVYYFRMYMAICVLSGLHGLMFLPVMLSIFGPGENAPPTCQCLLNRRKDDDSDRAPQLFYDNGAVGEQ